MASQEHPLHEILVGTEAFVLSRPSNSGPKLAYSSDTGVLFFLDGNDWYEFTGGATMVASSGSSNSSSRSSRSSESSSNSSAKRELYPELPAMDQQVNLSVDVAEVDIYTVINIAANIHQVFNIEIGLFELELTGLHVYRGTFSELTTQGNYIPLEGSYAFSLDATPEWLMSLASKFITSLQTQKKVITIGANDYQRIIFEQLPLAHLVDSTFTLQATATSSLLVTYTSSDTSIATIAGSTVTMLDSGDVTITASQSGNGDYEAAEDVTQLLRIKPPIVTRQSASTTGYTGIKVQTPINFYQDYVLSYWLKPTLPTTPGDYDIYFSTYSEGYFHRIYEDGSALIQNPNMSGTGLGIMSQGNVSNVGNPRYDHDQTGYIYPGTFTSDQWHHIAWVRSIKDCNTILYVNGARTATYTPGISFSTFTAPEYNGNYLNCALGKTYTMLTTDDHTGTPTWTDMHSPSSTADFLINGKPFYVRANTDTAVGAVPYDSTAAIFWDDVQNRWVLTDSPQTYMNQTGAGLFANLVVNEVNATKVMYTDNLAYGFTTGTNGWNGLDTGLVAGSAATQQHALGVQNMGNPYTEQEIRSGVRDDADLTRNANSHLMVGGGYATSAITHARDITEVAIWKDQQFDLTDIQTVFNAGHSNLSSPSSTILNLKGGPPSYFRGGMDDFLMSVGIRNVGSTLPSGQIADDMAELGSNAELIKYE